jgi:hypothetical protein
MQEGVTRQRAQSPELAATRAERKLLAPVRRGIGELQDRAAFILARMGSKQGCPPDQAKADLTRLRSTLDELTKMIEQLMNGTRGVGPADDCRRALNEIRERLPIL